MSTTKKGFDSDLYLRKQTQAISERVARCSKLYLECGGKLLDDQHAVRVLPGYEPDAKVRIMQGLGNDVEVIICIYAQDIEHHKTRNGFGPTYDTLALHLVSRLRSLGIHVANLVITRYNGESIAQKFSRIAKKEYNLNVTLHREVEGYPWDVEFALSDEGMGKNQYIETTRPIIVIAAPGPGSGKLGTCLGQLYHEYKRGNQAGYAKLESFPVWNLPLSHPLNVAYEAATAELLDRNMIDPYHFQAYQKVCVNYNRDIDAFPVLRAILECLTGNPLYYASPTDMGVNRIKEGIINDEVVQQACRQEVIYRYLTYIYDYAMGRCSLQVVRQLEQLLFRLKIRPEMRAVVPAARKALSESRNQAGKGSNGVYRSGAIQFSDKKIITGKNSPQLHAESVLVLNAIKELAQVPDHEDLLSAKILGQVTYLKRDILKDQEIGLDLEEMLIALSAASCEDKRIEKAMACLSDLKGCQVHLSHIPTPGDRIGLRKLGLNVTCDPYVSGEIQKGTFDLID